MRHVPQLLVSASVLAWGAAHVSGQDGVPLRSPYLETGSPYGDVAAGDLDGDGALDLVFSRTDGRLEVQLGAGGGTFHPAFLVARLPSVGRSTLGDFNGDGNLDVAVRQDAGPKAEGVIHVLLGHGDGTLGVARPNAVAPEPRELRAADLDGNGLLDLAVACEAADGVSVLLAAGGGAFAPYVLYPAALAPRGLAIGDVTEDGAPDLVVSRNQYGSAMLLAGDGAGAFRPPVPIPGATVSADVALGDLDHDGDLDAVLGNTQTNDIPVHENRGRAASPIPRSSTRTSIPSAWTLRTSTRTGPSTSWPWSSTRSRSSAGTARSASSC